MNELPYRKWIGKLHMIKNVLKQLNEETEPHKNNDNHAKWLWNCSQMIEGVIESYEYEMDSFKRKGNK